MSRSSAVVAACFVVCAASDAVAWDSVCLTSTGAECPPGPAAAIGSWRGSRGIHDDEHRQIFVRTVERAGLPTSLLARRTLGLPTNADQRVVALNAATTVLERRYSVDELAALPDFSYSLRDFADGHEGCVLAGSADIDGEECHRFESVMGATNSSHFVPQSQRWYAHYHALAVARAGDCAALDARVADDVEGDDVVLACEEEALAIEAVGQHFLQDAWATGHMWPRWGSPELQDFPSLSVARVVGAVGGLLHGAKGLQEAMQQAIGPVGVLVSVDDQLNAPNLTDAEDQLEWRAVDADAPFADGVGDVFWRFIDGVEGDPQFRRLMACATSGVLDVYGATGQRHGVVAASATVDPSSARCFGQRATNGGLARAAALNLRVDAINVTVELSSNQVTKVLVDEILCQGCSPDEFAGLQRGLRETLSGVAAAIELAALEAPDGTDLADGDLPPLLGVPNNAGHDVLPAYVDPPLPWRVDDAATRALATLFSSAHLDDWCPALGGGEDAISVLRDRCIAGDDVGCELCQRFAPWVVYDPDGGVDVAAAPLCGAVKGGTVIEAVSEDGDTRAGLAERWCHEEDPPPDSCSGGGIGCDPGGVNHRTICHTQACTTNWFCGCEGSPGCRVDGPFVVPDDPDPNAVELTCRSD